MYCTFGLNFWIIYQRYLLELYQTHHSKCAKEANNNIMLFPEHQTTIQWQNKNCTIFSSCSEVFVVVCYLSCDVSCRMKSRIYANYKEPCVKANKDSFRLQYDRMWSGDIESRHISSQQMVFMIIIFNKLFTI